MRLMWWQVAFSVSLVLVVFAPLASSSPDGLKRVAEDGGFASLAKEAPIKLIAGYLFPGIENEVLATILAGVIGVIVVCGVTYGLALVLKSRRKIQ